MPLTPEEKARKLAERIKQEVLRSAGAGLNAARLFLEARVKEAVSVAAVPRLKRKDGTFYCPTPAIPNAPVRKLSGNLQQRLTSEMRGEDSFVIGGNIRAKKTTKYPQGFPYGLYHEVKDPSKLGSGKHSYIRPTMEKHKKDLATIISGTVSI